VPPKVKKTYTRPSSLASYRKSQEKKYGERIIRKETRRPIDFIPSGVTGLDLALGGGWARGRYHQIIGQPNCCKTSMVLIAMKNALELYPDEGVVYLDVEKTVTEERFLAHGIDPDDERLMWRQPASGEEVADMLRDDLRTSLFSMAAIDSVGAMERSDALYDKAAEDSTMGKAAQLLTRMSKQITTISRETNTATFIVNQYRKNFDGGMDQAAGPMIMGYMTTDSVWKIGPPLVMANTKSNSCNPVMVAMRVVNSRAGRSAGSVTCRKRCHAFAPSKVAVSYRKAGTCCMPASRTIMANPTFFQMPTAITVGSASDVDCSQSGGEMPTSLSHPSIRPTCGSRRNFQMMPTTTSDAMNGKK